MVGWDLDGTLTDSVRFVVETANQIIKRHGGATLEYASVGRMTGLPLESIFRMAWPDLAADDARKLRDEYRELYDTSAIPATRLFRGALTTLRAAKRAGLRQATVTGKRAADCERILRGLGVRSEIDLFLGGDSVSAPKPAPDLALRAMSDLGVLARETAIVGDSTADMGMGKAAGATTIQVLWGFESARVADADHVVRSWPELRALLLRLAARASG